MSNGKDKVVEIVGIASAIISLVRLIVNLFGGEMKVKPHNENNTTGNTQPD